MGVGGRMPFHAGLAHGSAILRRLMSLLLGRENELEWLAHAWESSARHIFVTGDWGVGRRALLANFLERQKTDARVLFLRASTNPTIALARALKIRINPAEVQNELQRIRRALSARDRNVIVISAMGNGESAAADLREHIEGWSTPEAPGALRVFVRSNSESVFRGALHLKVGALSNSQSLALFAAVAKTLGLAGEQRILKSLVLRANGNPRLIRTIAGALQLGVTLQTLQHALACAGKDSLQIFQAVFSSLPAVNRTQLNKFFAVGVDLDVASASMIVFDEAPNALLLLRNYLEAGFIDASPFDGASRQGCSEMPVDDAMMGNSQKSARAAFVEYFTQFAKDYRSAATKGLTQSLWQEHENLEQALIFAEELENFEACAELFVALGRLYSPRGLFEPFIQRAQNLLQYKGRVSAESEARVRLACGEALLVTSNIASSEDELLRSLEIGRQLGDLELIVRSLGLLAYVAERKSMVASVDERIEQGFAALNKQVNPWLTAWLYRTRAILYARTGRVELASEDYKLAIVGFRNLGDASQLSAVLMRMGAWELEHGDIVLAAERTEEALQAISSLDDDRTRAECELSLAIIDIERGLFEQARTHVQRAESAFRFLGDLNMEASALGYTGNLYLEQGLHQEALAWYEKSIDLLQSGGNTRMTTLWCAAKAVALSGLGRSQQALVELDTARSGFSLNRPGYELIPEIVSTILSGNGSRIHEVLAFTEAKRFNDDVRFFLRLLRKCAGNVSTAERTWVFERSCLWFSGVTNERIDLAAYPTQRKVLARLLQERLVNPGNALTREQLVDSGWPGERMKSSAAANRIKVTLNRLRAHGLAADLQTRDGCYLLRADLPIRIASELNDASTSS
jgi:tetratricopeptide (TPR) repeat protein